MIQTFVSKEGFSNCYVICRFHECVIINPSHSYEQITSFIGQKTITALFLTEPSKITIDQIGYYQAPIYLTKRQHEEMINSNINGYDYLNKPSFNISNLKFNIIDNKYIFELADLNIKVYDIQGSKEALAVFELDNNLFVGNLFRNNRIAKKAKYKGSIYDLKKSIQEILHSVNNPLIYDILNKPRLLNSEIKQNDELRNWT